MKTQTATDLDDLIAEYLSAADRGAAPDPADWLARHPAHAADLAAFLADLGRFASFLGLSAPDSDLTTDYRDRSDGAEDRFGGYELLGEIGKGGMGVVYRARLRRTTLVVALKQIRPGVGSAARRLLEEVEAVAGLRHPNIVPVYHVGEHDGRPFFTMKLVEGGSLDRHLGRFRGDPHSAAVLVAKVARAVHHAHQRRVLHRDLKPSNILLDEAGEPHVADFGLATPLDESGSAAADAPAGSLPWMAPEAVRGDGTLTTAVDVWALGVILYELLTGTRPFPGTDPAAIRRAILERDPPAPRAVNPSVPRDLDAVCRRCLAKDPDRRYESASAVALELDRWLRDEPVRARRAGRGERFARWCRRNPGVAAGAAFAASLLVAAVVGSVRLAGELEGEVAALGCRNSAYEASHVAGNVLNRFRELSGAVLRTAGELDGKDPHDSADVLRKLVELPPAPGDATRPFVNAFLLDPDGTILATWPARGQAGPQSFPGRDYFARARRGAVHVSRVFWSERDEFDKLALATRFRPAGADRDWVLAATLTTADKLDLGVAAMSDEGHVACLVAPRDAAPSRPGAPPGEDEYVVLVHPALKGAARALRFGTDRPGPPRANESPEIGPAPAGEARPFAADPDFRDPLAPGRWLTGSARVGNTELVVVVQQRYDDAVRPHESFLGRFLAWVGGAVAVGLLTFAALRLLRARGPAGAGAKS